MIKNILIVDDIGNGGRRCYRASKADQAVWDRACRSKICKLVANRALARIVAKQLQLEWSPEQVAGWLKHTYPDDESRDYSRAGEGIATRYQVQRDGIANVRLRSPRAHQ